MKRMNIRPTNIQERAVYLLLNRLKVSYIEMRIVSGTSNLNEFLDRLRYQLGINIEYKKTIGNIGEIRLIDHAHAAKIYEKIITRRLEYEDRLSECISLYQEFPDLTAKDIAKIMGLSIACIQKMSNKIFSNGYLVA